MINQDELYHLLDKYDIQSIKELEDLILNAKGHLCKEIADIRERDALIKKNKFANSYWLFKKQFEYGQDDYKHIRELGLNEYQIKIQIGNQIKSVNHTLIDTHKKWYIISANKEN